MTGGNTWIETSNRTYLYSIHAGNVAYEGAYEGMMMSAVVDMDANDTANLGITFGNDTKTVDIKITYTYFSGALLC